MTNNSRKTFLDRTAILAINDLKTEEVWVPEWNTHVRVRSLTAAERDQLEIDSLTGKGRNRTINLSNFRARLAVRSCVDDTGARLFSDADVNVLAAKSAAALERITEAAQRLSGMRPEDVEELTANLDGDPTDD